MSSYHTTFSKFIGIIHLKKTNFFGFKKIIYIVVTPTFKVLKIEHTHTTDIPIKKGEIINIDVLSKWVTENKYKLSFLTKNSKLKRDLYFIFDDIILHKYDTKKNKFIDYIKSLLTKYIFIKNEFTKKRFKKN